MLVLLSPAKNLDFSPARAVAMTTPVMGEHTALLSRTTRNLSGAKLRELMDISEELARLNKDRFQHFDDPDTIEMPAAFAFAGEVYRGLDARSLDDGALERAQARIRILSGMYGVLRPLDAMRPYRLEMGTRLKTRRGESLYQFWGSHIAKALNADLAALGSDLIVNAASDEYFKAVDRKVLKGRVVDVAFYDEKDGKARQLFVFVKRARGLFARFVAEHDITTKAGIIAFESEGYRFDKERSGPDRYAFIRPQPPKKSQGLH
jgi:uncharacterized protein